MFLFVSLPGFGLPTWSRGNRGIAQSQKYCPLQGFVRSVWEPGAIVDCMEVEKMGVGFGLRASDTTGSFAGIEGGSALWLHILRCARWWHDPERCPVPA